MKRTMLAAVIGGFMALTASAFTAQAAPVAAVQVGKLAQSGEALVQKTEWRGHHRYYRRHHYRPHYSHRRHYRPHYAYRHRHWQPRHHYQGGHAYRHNRRHYN